MAPDERSGCCARAEACANIALVKYWGKRDEALRLPEAGSLSLTLEALRTTTCVELIEGPSDEVWLDGSSADDGVFRRLSSYLDVIRQMGGSRTCARVRSENAFPTAAGLASSASGFAALATAGAAAYGLTLDDRGLSVLARRGSGSAARSVVGGFAVMHPGSRPDGTDAFAEAVPQTMVELEAVIALSGLEGEKSVGSSEGMRRTAATSPYHLAWTRAVGRDLKIALQALRAGDFDILAKVTEGSCLAMHANAMAARPGILYFSDVTLRVIECVRALRQEGLSVFFTVDAGPHVVAFCAPQSRIEVARAIESVRGVSRIICSAAGFGARLLP